MAQSNGHVKGWLFHFKSFHSLNTEQCLKILHANWLPDCAVVSFWIEDPDKEWSSSSTSLYDYDGMTNPHPFALAEKQLLSHLPKALDPFGDTHILRLPTANDAPVPSTKGIGIDANLAPWEVASAEVLAESFIEFVFSKAPESLTDAENVLGQDLTYWCELANFGRLLYEHGHFAPGVVTLEGKDYAAWKAVFCNRGEALWHRYLNAMPAVCCSILDQDALDMTPEHLVITFLDACVDALARHHHLRRNPGYSPPKGGSQIHRQWLGALQYGRFQNLNMKVGAAQAFVHEVTNWTRLLRPRSFDHPWRLTFELCAPENAVGEWRLDFVLTNVRETGQSVTAESMWTESRITELFPGIQETLFAGLGQTLGIYPRIKDSLTHPQPSCLYMDADEAADFMMDVAPQLRRSGFPVKLPVFWDDDSSGLGMRINIQSEPSSGQDRSYFLGISDLIDYKWELTLGESELTEDEFRELADSKQKVVFQKGRWFKIEHDRLKSTIDFIDTKGAEGRSSLTDLLKMSSQVESKGGLPISDIVMPDEPTSLSAEHLHSNRFEMLSQPPTFVGTLPPYQLQGFSWMIFMKSLNLGACLADDMGLGKTIQMISVLLEERRNGANPGPSLVISPMSVVGNWVHELARFSPTLKVMVHHGSDRLEESAFTEAVAEHDVVISTYNLVLRDRSTFSKVEWENIVLDEAQNIKNPAAKQSKAIRSLNGRHRFCLTGTPIENRLTELWSIMDFLNPGFLGNLGNFRSCFSQPIERDNNSNRAVILQRIIRPFILRRLKSDKEIIRDLPEKEEMKVYCNLSAEQAALYQAVVDQMIDKIGATQGIERKGLVLSTLTKLKQISNHPAHFLRDNSAFTTTRSGKLQRLVEMLEVVLDAGDRALIFSQFTEFGDKLCRKLEETFGVDVLYLHGGSTKKQRDEMVQRFQRPNGPPLFLLSLKAGGVGLNLTAANHVFHFDRWWNPAIEDQATDRSYRIGQRKNVQVHKFICVGTVEEKIDKMIEEKKQLAANIVTPGETYLTELSTEELLEVFSLSRDTIIE